LLHYDRKHAENINVDFSNKGYSPAFDFGFGMSYSNFNYSSMVVSKNKLNDNDSIQVSVVVKNNSEMKGKEVVQIYYADLVASITPSVKKLLGFKKIELKAGEQQTITFQIHKNDLSFINKQLKRVTEAGEFDLMIQNETKRIYVN
jgi:beta-glucosidase